MKALALLFQDALDPHATGDLQNAAAARAGPFPAIVCRPLIVIACR
jgi:hypothetical protein